MKRKLIGVAIVASLTLALAHGTVSAQGPHAAHQGEALAATPDAGKKSMMDGEHRERMEKMHKEMHGGTKSGDRQAMGGEHRKGMKERMKKMHAGDCDQAADGSGHDHGDTGQTKSAKGAAHEGHGSGSGDCLGPRAGAAPK